MALRVDHVVLSCEHATRRIPAGSRHLFEGKSASRALESHRGSDLGALSIARALARRLGAPLFVAEVSRLLVELNRSEHHRKLFSSFVDQRARPEEKEALLALYYRPYRARVEGHIRAEARRGRTVLHISVHSFTPELEGRVRTADVGLLYDPRRSGERDFAARWIAALARVAPTLRLRRNYPYLGRADGFTTALRREFPEGRYLGIELETNQALLVPKSSEATKTTRALVESLVAALSAQERAR